MDFRLEHVKFKNILDIPELEIPADKVTCIIGKSGSGKTRLMTLLNGMISPDSGEVYAGGKPLGSTNLIELRRKVIMLQQNPSIFGGTIRENLNIGRKFSEQQAATDSEMKAVLETVHLNKQLDDEVDKLSGGEKQRLAFARVLLLSPEALLLDEPTSALDEDTAHEIMQKVLATFKKRNQTVVMVTHAQAIVDAFAEYVVEIEAGRIVRSGGVKQQ